MKKISVILGEFHINVRDIKFYYERVKHDDFENCYNVLLKYVSGDYSYLEILKRIGQIFKPYFERNGNKEFIIIGEVDSTMKNMGVSLDDLYAYYGGMKNGKQGKYNEVDKRYFLLIRDIRGKKDFSSLDFGEMVKKYIGSFLRGVKLVKLIYHSLKIKSNVVEYGI